MNISNIHDLKTIVRNGPYAWPGGYPIYFITSDGDALSYETVKSEYRLICESIRDHDDSGWRVIAADINYEDSSLFCEHTGELIESAYSD